MRIQTAYTIRQNICTGMNYGIVGIYLKANAKMNLRVWENHLRHFHTYVKNRSGILPYLAELFSHEQRLLRYFSVQ